jgi:hypothetical protein
MADGAGPAQAMSHSRFKYGGTIFNGIQKYILACEYIYNLQRFDFILQKAAGKTLQKLPEGTKPTQGSETSGRILYI